MVDTKLMYNYRLQETTTKRNISQKKVGMITLLVIMKPGYACTYMHIHKHMHTYIYRNK